LRVTPRRKFAALTPPDDAKWVNAFAGGALEMDLRGEDGRAAQANKAAQFPAWISRGN